MSLLVDVEDRKRAESALLTADRRKDEFLAMPAHELRNPLAPIGNAARVISSSGTSDERILWATGVIARQASLLALTQVLANLLNNASKYSEEGGRICVEVERTATDAVIRVTDSGVGLAREMIPVIFDLFTQADRTLDRAQGGLGLGLSIVRQLVELHRGSVDASSDCLGQGSTFTVRLPLLAQAAAVRLAREAAAVTVAATSRRILVVDDNVDGALTLAQVLAGQGHQVSVAHDGPTALELSAASGVDVVILDIGLPGMGGYSVARTLRGRPDTARALLIAVTGYGQPEDIQMALDAGFDRHVVKPVDLDELSALIAGGAGLPGA